MQTDETENLNQTVQTLERDGFVMFKNFFDSALAESAHKQMESLYSKDLQARREQGIKEARWNGPSGVSVLTEPTHLMIDAYTKSPALDQMFEKFLTDPKTKPVIEKLAGPHIKLRGYNVRRMTGAFDPPPSHEWHRDSTGEFGFGILLTDVEPGENGATAFVPGSHLFPYCPRWNNLFYTPPKVLPSLVKKAIFNKLLGKKVLKNHTGASGKKGDAYIFINDSWHGRQPNLHGKESMVVLIGAYPTDYEFPDKVTPPPAEILAKLPPNLAAVASCKLPVNEMSDTILRRMVQNRQPIGFLTLWRAARLERRLVVFLSDFYNQSDLTDWWNQTGHLYKKNIYRPIRIALGKIIKPFLKG
jgi:putative 2OG-Fe(II) oxygenase